MQNILTLETNKYNIKIENFEGPLDLLCHLIDDNQMDIYDIRISEVTDQYINYINKMQEMDLEVTSEFLLMASNLLYIKSKKLLPRQDDEDEMMSEEELIRRIIQYKQYKEITNKLKIMCNNNRFFGMAELIELPQQELIQELSYNDIYNIYKIILAKNTVRINKNAKNIEKIAITETYSVGDSVKKMFRELIRKSHFVFNRLFSSKKCESQEIVTAFSGLLEMSRRSKIETSQDELFGDITVRKKKRNV